MKRILIIFLVVFSLSLLTGCGKPLVKKPPVASTPNAQQQPTQTAEIQQPVAQLALEKYNNKYFSFEYRPSEWTLQENKSLVNAKESELFIKSVEKDNKNISSLYVLGFTVYYPDELIRGNTKDDACGPARKPECLEKLSRNKSLIPVNINNFKEFLNLNFYFDQDLTMRYREYFNFKGKTCAVELKGNKNIFYGIDMYCFTQGKVVKIKVVDFSQIPIDQIAETKTNLISLISNKFYGDLINSIIIK